MKIVKPKKAAKKPEKVEDKTVEYPSRLAELEAELRTYPSRPPTPFSISSIKNPKEAVVGKETVVKFTFDGKVYATGHSDLTYADSAHGIRHISFYADEKVVLYIEGNFEDQQFGSNFQFHNLEIYTPGEWEANFVALSEELRERRMERRESFRQKQLNDKTNQTRDRSRR
jgi:hypothetical protein